MFAWSGEGAAGEGVSVLVWVLGADGGDDGGEVIGGDVEGVLGGLVG